MSKISKFVKLDKNVLLEYIYNDGNLIGEAYNVLVNSKDRTRSYLATDTSGTNNIQSNSLFRLDAISGRYGKINPDGYSFLQLKNYSAPNPIRHDVLKVHLPINWTFGEYLGFYLHVYAFDTVNQVTYDLSNFYFDMTDVGQSYLLNFTTPPLLFQEKLWGKNIQIEIPALSELSAQLVNNLPKENSINANLTNGSGLNSYSPIFIDFHFIKAIQTVNSVTTYLVDPAVTTTVPQSPEFENLALVVKHSENGDFFEIYGTYNDTIAGFKKFIDDSVSMGNRYYVQYDITLYEQNIRGKTLTITVTDAFNEPIEYRPIIKFTTTTAIIDVEMRLIDAVDESTIIRRASYGMLQDEVSKYSLNLTKINLSNAAKPKIYNIKNAINPSLVGVANSMGMLSVNNSTKSASSPRQGSSSSNLNTTKPIIQTVQVPYPVLVDRYNVMAKSENTVLDSKTFYGYGKLQIVLYPFDNVLKFVIATGTAEAPTYLDLSRFTELKLTFRTDQTIQSFPIYLEAGDVDLALGNVTFKVPQTKYTDIKKIYSQNVNVFYITGTNQNVTSVIYTGLFKVYDSTSSVAELNQQAATPGIILDTTLPKETAIVTRKPLSEMKPTLKPSNMKNISILNGGKSVAKASKTQSNTSSAEYVTTKKTSSKELANAIGVSVNDFTKLNGFETDQVINAQTVVKVPSDINFKTPLLVIKK